MTEPTSAAQHVSALRTIFDKLDDSGAMVADVKHWVSAARNTLTELETAIMPAPASDPID